MDILIPQLNEVRSIQPKQQQSFHFFPVCLCYYLNIIKNPTLFMCLQQPVHRQHQDWCSSLLEMQILCYFSFSSQKPYGWVGFHAPESQRKTGAGNERITRIFKVKWKLIRIINYIWKF